MTYTIRQWIPAYGVAGATTIMGPTHRGLSAEDFIAKFDEFAPPRGCGCEIWQDDGHPVYACDLEEIRSQVQGP